MGAGPLPAAVRRCCDRDAARDRGVDVRIGAVRARDARPARRRGVRRQPARPLSAQPRPRRRRGGRSARRPRLAATVRFRVSGSAAVTVEGAPLEAAADDEYLVLQLPSRERRSGSRSSAATARCRRSPSRRTRPLRSWVASVEGGAWEPVRPRVGGDRPPHLDAVGSVDVVARRDHSAVFDVGAPVLGRPILPPGPRPVVSSGESPEEALADGTAHETRHDLVELPGGGGRRGTDWDSAT